MSNSDNDINNLLLDITNGLLEKSKRKQVRWTRVGSGLIDDFIVNLPDYSINVYASETGQYHLQLYNSVGDSVFDFSPNINSREYQLLGEIIKLAELKTSNLAQVLNDIKLSLRTNKILGDPNTKSLNDDEIPF